MERVKVQKISDSDVACSLGYTLLAKDPGSHSYQLVVEIQNVGRMRIDDYDIEIEFPTVLLLPKGKFDGISRIEKRSTKDSSFFRAQHNVNGSLYVGDSQDFVIPFQVNRDLYMGSDQKWKGSLTRARVFLRGKLEVTLECCTKELQEF